MRTLRRNSLLAWLRDCWRGGVPPRAGVKLRASPHTRWPRAPCTTACCSMFGKEVSRDLLSRLRFKDLIASGPRSPRPGAPHTFVTTEAFLATFDLHSLRDLPELEIAVGETGSDAPISRV